MPGTALPKDANAVSIQTFPKSASREVAFDATTLTNRSTAIPGSIVQVYCTSDCYVKRVAVDGNAVKAVGADIIPCPAGIMMDIDIPVPGTNNYLAFVGVSAAGTAWIYEGR